MDVWLVGATAFMSFNPQRSLGKRNKTGSQKRKEAGCLAGWLLGLTVQQQELVVGDGVLVIDVTSIICVQSPYFDALFEYGISQYPEFSSLVYYFPF